MVETGTPVPELPTRVRMLVPTSELQMARSLRVEVEVGVEETLRAVGKSSKLVLLHSLPRTDTTTT